jgi:hypothetical protein
MLQLTSSSRASLGSPPSGETLSALSRQLRALVESVKLAVPRESTNPEPIADDARRSDATVASPDALGFGEASLEV